MHPAMMEQLAAARREDIERWARAVGAGRSRHRLRRRLALRAAQLLVRTGQRLADPELVTPALPAERIGR